MIDSASKHLGVWL